MFVRRWQIEVTFAETRAHLGVETQRQWSDIAVARTTPALILQAALDGHGLATTFETQVEEHVTSGRLIRVMQDWCAPYPGFFLYYPSRRQTPPAMAALLEALRFRS